MFKLLYGRMTSCWLVHITLWLYETLAIFSVKIKGSKKDKKLIIHLGVRQCPIPHSVIVKMYRALT